jgi:hypothetical protein
VHLLLSSLFHIILTTTTTSLPVILTVAAARYRYFLQQRWVVMDQSYSIYYRIEWAPRGVIPRELAQHDFWLGWLEQI